MQIPTDYGTAFVFAFSVGLATIGVCVFCAVASVAALFIFSIKSNKKEPPTKQKQGDIKMRPNYVAKKSAWSVLSFWSIVACILIIPILVLIYRILEIKKYRIEFYDDKIITYSGLINISKRQCVFMGVTSTSINQTLAGRIFGYGDVVVDCVGKWDVDTTYIKQPMELEYYLQTKIIASNTANQFIHV